MRCWRNASCRSRLRRELSRTIGKAGGDYVWIMDPECGSRGKDNQPETLRDLERLFAPEPCTPGFSPASHDNFRTARTVEKSHGRIERRTITVSSALKGYLDWPYVEQVFKLERHFVRMRDGKVMDERVYGVTSLTAQEACPEWLLQLVREHWQIENGLHYRRDDTLKEDRCTLRTGHAAQAMAVINNLVLGLLLRRGVKNVPEARRDFAANPKKALQLLLQHP